MPWNQPGSGNRDPWGQGGGRKGPPDLDEIVKNVQNRLGGLFGGRGGRGAAGSPQSGFVAGLVILGLVLFWIYQSVYQVQQGWEGIELRFGKYSQTTNPGLNWIWWPAERVVRVNRERVNVVEVGLRKNVATGQTATVAKEALMLTRDENIVDLQLAVQYNIKNSTDLVFFVADDPHLVVRGATESVLREVVGTSTMDFVLTEGREEVAKNSEKLLQTILDRYRTGIHIISVEMQDAQPPKEVKPAFDDAVKAREDQERFKNQAEAYRNDILPRARGGAARIRQQAEGYKQAVIARAEGEAERFVKILDEYQKAPQITRDRLYIESMEQVLSKSSKIMIDQTGSNNIFYLPLDQLIQKRRDVVPPLASDADIGLLEQQTPKELKRGTRRADREGR